LIGSSIARLLAQAGKRVAVVDKGQFGSEASAAGAGMLTPGGEFREGSDAARFAMESLAEYPEFVARLREESRIPIDFRVCGALELAYERDEWEGLLSRAELQRCFGMRVEPVDSTRVEQLAPGVRGKELRGALHYPDDGVVNPADMLRALRVTLERAGVAIIENAPVTRIEADLDSLMVDMDGQVLHARFAVLSAGAWSSLIPVVRAGVPLHLPKAFPVRGHLAGYSLPAGSLGPIVRRGHHYVVQRVDGFTIAGSCEEHCEFNRGVNPEKIFEIQKAVTDFYAPLRGEQPIREWIGFRPGADREGPVIERVNGTGLWLAYGHYRNGILLTPATADRVADAILSAGK
jgi:glycine oxidase